MKAISLWQPWASLIACGAKPFETRSWSPPPNLIGERIAIHAAKKVDKGAAEFATELMYGQHQHGGFELADKLAATFSGASDSQMAIFGETAMPAGCVVATAILDAAFMLGGPADGTAMPAARVVKRLTSREMPSCFSVRYDDFGDYTEGRWAWLLREVRAINPPARAKGAQGIFELPQGWLVAA